MTSSHRDMDKLTPEQRRRCMQAVKGRDTLPEVIVRKWLHAQGFRFRVCDKISKILLDRFDFGIMIAWLRHNCVCGLI